RLFVSFQRLLDLVLNLVDYVRVLFERRDLLSIDIDPMIFRFRFRLFFLLEEVIPVPVSYFAGYFDAVLLLVFLDGLFCVLTENSVYFALEILFNVWVRLNSLDVLTLHHRAFQFQGARKARAVRSGRKFLRLKLVEGTRVVFASAARASGRGFIRQSEVFLHSLRDFLSGFFRLLLIEHVMLVVVFARRVHKPELDENRGHTRMFQHVKVRRLNSAVAEPHRLHDVRMNFLRELFPFGTAGIVVRLGPGASSGVPVERNEKVCSFRVGLLTTASEGGVIISSGPDNRMSEALQFLFSFLRV